MLCSLRRLPSARRYSRILEFFSERRERPDPSLARDPRVRTFPDAVDTRYVLRPGLDDRSATGAAREVCCHRSSEVLCIFVLVRCDTSMCPNAPRECPWPLQSEWCFVNVTRDFVTDAEYVSNTVAELQTLARELSRPLSPEQAVITVQVVFVAGTTSPWRLIETTSSAVGRRRSMACFDSLQAIHRSIEERLAWQRADQQIVERHMATPGGFPGITADWVHSQDFDATFGPSRDAMRREMCPTSPKQTVTL